jgi:hypothetical protein
MLTALLATIGETTTDWIIAIGTVFAALGTVLAVSVALWQGWRQNTADLRVRAELATERIGGGSQARTFVRLHDTNHGPQTIKVNQALLQFKSGASGAIIGQTAPRGDELPKVLAVGDAVTGEWDEEAVELARAESNGEPYKSIAFIDAFGNEHAAPYPGMTRKWRARKRRPWLRREYVRVGPSRP